MVATSSISNYQLSSKTFIFSIKMDVYKILNQILILANSVFQYGQYNREFILASFK